MLAKQRITLGSVVKVSGSQVSADLAGETAILNLDAGIYYGLDQVGSHIWNRIKQPCSVRDLKEDILHEFEVGPVNCEADLLEFLNRLLDQRLIEVEG
jgi:hypothetical protein